MTALPLTGYATSLVPSPTPSVSLTRKHVNLRFPSLLQTSLPSQLHTISQLSLPDRNYGYAFSPSAIEYQTAILIGDTEAAAEILPMLPKDQLNKARFIEACGTSFFLLEFYLPLSLDDLDTALQITYTIIENGSEIKWEAFEDRALTVEIRLS